VKAVLAGDSFDQHASEETLNEIARVLVPNGRLGLIWATRDASLSWLQEIEDIIAPYYLEIGESRQQYGTWKKYFTNHSNFEMLNVISSVEMPIETVVQNVKVNEMIDYVHNLYAVKKIADENQLEDIAEQIRDIFLRYTAEYLHFQTGLNESPNYNKKDRMYTNMVKDDFLLFRRQKKFEAATTHRFFEELPLKFIIEMYWAELKVKPEAAV